MNTLKKLLKKKLYLYNINIELPVDKAEAAFCANLGSTLHTALKDYNINNIEFDIRTHTTHSQMDCLTLIFKANKIKSSTKEIKYFTELVKYLEKDATIKIYKLKEI